MKVFSGLADLPGGTASESLTEGCLVLEGGGFRGVYTQGFLDAMMENDLNLSAVIGVSAGALGGANYVSGQIGRSARINLRYRHDSRYVGLRAFLKSRSILDLGFLIEDRGILEPLDWERFNRPERRFVAVTTDCLSGKTAYFEKGKHRDFLLAVRASATMPYISPPVIIDGRPYFDGGCSTKIPYEWALEEGYGKIVVIRTREASYRARKRERNRAARVYRRYPAFAETLSREDEEYNRELDALDALEKEGRLLVFCPSEPPMAETLEKDMEKLGALYYLGRNDCLRELERLKSYLGA